MTAPSARLTELRAAAAHRVNTMPMGDDTPEEVAERADLVEAFMPLQLTTDAWNAGDDDFRKPE